MAIEYRWAEGRYDQLPAMADELVGRKVDVIVATALPSIRAARNATSTIPIGFIAGDPVDDGVVASLARPEGNLTGISILALEIKCEAARTGLSKTFPDECGDCVRRQYGLTCGC